MLESGVSKPQRVRTLSHLSVCTSSYNPSRVDETEIALALMVMESVEEVLHTHSDFWFHLGTEKISRHIPLTIRHNDVLQHPHHISSQFQAD